MSKVGLRLAFAGTSVLAATVLSYLLRQNTHEVVFVITRPDRPAGRGRILAQSPVKMLAEKHGLPLRQPLQPADIDPENKLSLTDVLVVAAFGMILPVEILLRPKLGSINVHTSLLPRWRGAAPIQRAIQAGDSKTGVTIMQIAAGLDMGDILQQQICAIDPGETAGSLHDKLANLGGTCLLETLDHLSENSLTPTKQDNKVATYAHKISKEEATINWYLTAVELERTVRAFNPAPISHTVLRGMAMRVWEADVVTLGKTTVAPGTIIDCNTEGVIIATARDALRIKRLQLPGKKVITAQEFHNGYPDLLKP